MCERKADTLKHNKSKVQPLAMSLLEIIFSFFFHLCFIQLICGIFFPCTLEKIFILAVPVEFFFSSFCYHSCYFTGQVKVIITELDPWAFLM